MKRFCVCLLALLMLLAPFACASVSVRMDENACLLTENGGELVAPGTYSDIAPLGCGLFAARTDAGYALMSDGGALLTEPCYEALRCMGGMLLAKRDGRWGVLSRKGEPLSEFDYTRAVFDSAGNGWAITGNPNDSRSDRLLLLSPDGAAQETNLYVLRMDTRASDGLIAVQLAESGLYGYCGADGRMAIQARFDSASAFSAGRAVVSLNGRCGVVDAQSALIVPAKYDFAQVSEAGIAVVWRAGEARALRADGSEIARFEGASVSIALLGSGFVVADDVSCRAYDGEGQEIASASAQASFQEGLMGQLIVADGAWGEECVYIAGTQAQYQNLYPLGETSRGAVYAFMKANAARYTNDILNETQLSTDMESARYGVAGADGEELLPAQYLSVAYLGNDRLLARTQDAWLMLDISGKIYWRLSTEAQGAVKPQKAPANEEIS